MPPFVQACLGGIVVTLFAASAAAQSTASEDRAEDRDTAATAASDAFGGTVGINQVGLYSPYQTRGFDLVSTGGSFRIDGFYFHPAALPSESLVSGSSINVGVAAAALDLPIPTGVVGYRLRDPGERSALSITAGTRGFGAPGIEALGSLVSDDGRVGVVAHSYVSPDEKWSAGQNGARFDAGAVAHWSAGPATRVRAFAGIGYTSLDGDLAVLSRGDAMPPPLRTRRNYSPAWARSRSTTGNFGALVEHRSGGWALGAAAVRSTRDAPRTDTTVLQIDGAGNVARTLYHTPMADVRSDSVEVKAFRRFALAGANHRIGLAYRRRNTVSRRADAIAIPAGSFALASALPPAPRPDLPTNVPLSRDQVDQSMLSATYALSAGDAFELRLGVHHTRYRKAFRDTRGTRSSQRDTSWLYSASALWRPAARLRVFASYVSGLEESGVAPDAAANRGAVLPPVEARQYEIGARYDLAPGLGLIVAGFDIRKPIYGLRPDAIYAPAGTVRHRGVEASLTGQLTTATTVVLGANILQARISGNLVDAGTVNPVAPGVSRFNATIAVEQRLTASWSIDGYLLHEGRRRRDGASTIEAPAMPFSYVGTRFDWTTGGTPLSLRAQLVNIFNRTGYYATPYGPLVPVGGQHWRLLLTARF